MVTNRVTKKTVAQLIDAYGESLPEVERLEREIKALQEQLRPYREMLQELVDAVNLLHDNAGDDETFVDLGEEYEAVVTERGRRRRIKDVRAFAQKIGHEKFFEIAKVELKEVDALLNAEEKKIYVAVDRVARRVSVRKRGE